MWILNCALVSAFINKRKSLYREVTFRTDKEVYVLNLLVQQVKNPPAVQVIQETWVWSLSWEDPLENETATTPVFLPGESHGHRSLEGYSPWGHKVLDKTEYTRAEWGGVYSKKYLRILKVANTLSTSKQKEVKPSAYPQLLPLSAQVFSN